MYCNYCGKVIQMTRMCVPIAAFRVVSRARKHLMRRRRTQDRPVFVEGWVEYFDLDVVLVRVVWLIVAIMTGVGFVAYVIAWIVMPESRL